MRSNRHEMLDEVLLARRRADFAASAALLCAVERKWRALDIAAVRDGHEHIFFDD